MSHILRYGLENVGGVVLNVPMNEIKDLTPGTRFHYFGVDYELVRWTGKVGKQPRRNQWGRSVGGHYDADTVVVKVNHGPYRGWTRPHYTAFPVGARVTVINGRCDAERCAWRYREKDV